MKWSDEVREASHGINRTNRSTVFLEQLKGNEQSFHVCKPVCGPNISNSLDIEKRHEDWWAFELLFNNLLSQQFLEISKEGDMSWLKSYGSFEWSVFKKSFLHSLGAPQILWLAKGQPIPILSLLSNLSAVGEFQEPLQNIGCTQMCLVESLDAWVDSSFCFLPLLLTNLSTKGSKAASSGPTPGKGLKMAGPA